MEKQYTHMNCQRWPYEPAPAENLHFTMSSVPRTTRRRLPLDSMKWWGRHSSVFVLMYGGLYLDFEEMPALPYHGPERGGKCQETLAKHGKCFESLPGSLAVFKESKPSADFCALCSSRTHSRSCRLSATRLLCSCPLTTHTTQHKSV